MAVRCNAGLGIMLDHEELQAREKQLRFWRDGAKWRCAIPRDDMATRLGFDWKRYGIRGCGETRQAALDDWRSWMRASDFVADIY